METIALNPPSEILDGFYFLGDSYHGTQTKISVIINITETSFDSYFESHGQKYKRIHCSIPDHPSADIAQFFEPIAILLDEAEKNGQRALVHCGEGVSRSVSMTLAYLVLRKKYRLLDALLYVKSIRPQVNPNNGFVRQLIALEKKLMGASSLDEKMFEDDWGFGCLDLYKEQGPTLRQLQQQHKQKAKRDALP